MPQCENPECRKEIPEGKKYCGEPCLMRHLELKKNLKLTDEESIWLGQERRKITIDTIKKLARELLPMRYNQFSCIVAYRTGLSLRKVTEDYLHVLLGIGFLEKKDGQLSLRDGSNAS